MFRRRINYYPFLLLILAVAFLLSAFILDYKLKASIIEIARAKAQIKVMEKINMVINEQIVANVEYRDIVEIHKDKDDRIVLLQPNTILLNKMMAGSVIEITRAMDKLTEESIEIPLGQITGSKILAGYGPKIKVRMITAGQINVDVLDKFEEASINQTRHLIYFHISSQVKVAVPFLDEEVKVATTIPLAETIIIGNVPETYVGLKNDKVPIYPFMDWEN